MNNTVQRGETAEKASQRNEQMEKEDLEAAGKPGSSRWPHFVESL